MTNNRHSKPTTLSYFIKRITGSGYRVAKLWSEYSYADPRYWTVMIDPGCASVICTCYVNRNNVGDNYFEFYDGGQFLPTNMKIKTQSIEVLIEYLVKYGINNKMTDAEKKAMDARYNEENTPVNAPATTPAPAPVNSVS